MDEIFLFGDLQKCKIQGWRIHYDNLQLSFYKTKAEEIFVNEDNDEHSESSERKPYANALNYSSVLNFFSEVHYEFC